MELLLGCEELELTGHLGLASGDRGDLHLRGAY
jgi:hypothetical protein